MRIYVDGVNVVTGRTTQEQGEQDYFVLPDQEYVNGYKPNPRAPLMQFRCPPLVQADATRRDYDSLVADHLLGTGDLVEVAVPGKPRRKPRLLKPDTYPAFGWEPSRTTIFNVHMLNSKGACELFANCRPDNVDEEEERMYGVTGTGFSGCLVQFDPEPASTKLLMPFRTAAQPVHPENRDTIS
ncbi:hypothetical protein J4E89_000223 [Alternaria sp. Ai002NY15]|nr:hypothetical protein J4E89_000223 [Alternaria sp. Ai002NY15]